MSLHQKIKQDIKSAMIAKDQLKTTVLRGVQAEIQKELITKNSNSEEAEDEQTISIIKRLVKQRKDSIDQFIKGGRPELADNEKKELEILSLFLPATMSKEEIRKIAETKKSELGISDKTGLGKLIGAIAKDLKGKADGADIKEAVESLF